MFQKLVVFILIVGTSNQSQAQKQPSKKPTQSEIAKYIEQTKQDNEIVIGSSKDKLGLGNNDGVPQGTELKLPPGVIIETSCTFNPKDTLVGGSAAFIVPLKIRACRKVSDKRDEDNAGSIGQSWFLEIPEGLILITEYQNGQNGLLVERVRINVPPYLSTKSGDDSSCVEMTVNVAVACLNENKTNFGMVKVNDKESLTSDYFDATCLYKPGKVTTDPNLLKLLAVLAKYPKLKQIKKFPSRLAVIEAEGNGETYVKTKEQQVLSKVQEYIWKITDGPGITRTELKKLEEALAPYK